MGAGTSGCKLTQNSKSVRWHSLGSAPPERPSQAVALVAGHLPNGRRQELPDTHSLSDERRVLGHSGSRVSANVPDVTPIGPGPHEEVGHAAPGFYRTVGPWILCVLGEPWQQHVVDVAAGIILGIVMVEKAPRPRRESRSEFDLVYIS